MIILAQGEAQGQGGSSMFRDNQLLFREKTKVFLFRQNIFQSRPPLLSNPQPHHIQRQLSPGPLSAKITSRMSFAAYELDGISFPQCAAFHKLSIFIYLEAYEAIEIIIKIHVFALFTT